MKIVKTYSEDGGASCCAGGKCPSLHTTDDGRVIVQGIRLLTDEKAVLSIPDREDVVAMDIATFRHLVNKLQA